MLAILEETRKTVYAGTRHGKPVSEIVLPLTRLHEFLLAAASDRCLTTDEIKQMRQSALRGEARAWGVPVRFE